MTAFAKKSRKSAFKPNNCRRCYLLLMRRLLSALFAFTIFLTAPAWAMADGGQVFSNTCAQCHAGGENLIEPTKTLKKAALEATLANYSSGHEEAIIAQVTNGKGGMPPFGDTLSASDIADVAAYVESMANSGW